jgi:hypothetical protein
MKLNNKRTAPAEASGFILLRHERPSRQGHRYFIPGPRAHKSGDWQSLRNGPTACEVLRPGLSEEAKAIEDRVQSFAEDELLARYHDLVDQRFERPLPYTERFELERIETRLDYQIQTSWNA